jgi:hypothetical protein
MYLTKIFLPGFFLVLIPYVLFPCRAIANPSSANSTVETEVSAKANPEALDALEPEDIPPNPSSGTGPAIGLHLGLVKANTLRDVAALPADDNYEYMLRIESRLHEISPNKVSGNSARSYFGLGGELTYPVSIKTQNGELNFSARVAARYLSAFEFSSSYLSKASFHISLQASAWQFPQTLLAAWGPSLGMSFVGPLAFFGDQHNWIAQASVLPFKQLVLKQRSQSSKTTEVDALAQAWSNARFGIELQADLGLQWQVSQNLWLQSMFTYRNVFAQINVDDQGSRLGQFQKMYGVLIGLNRVNDP